jgi:hypothetical protein
MRNQYLILAALLSQSALAAPAAPFNETCLENESVIASVQPQKSSLRQQVIPARAKPVGEVCQYGQLTREDLSYVESVQPSEIAPLVLPVIVGEVCQYGQLTREDLSYIESVQPVRAVRLISDSR